MVLLLLLALWRMGDRLRPGAALSANYLQSIRTQLTPDLIPSPTARPQRQGPALRPSHRLFSLQRGPAQRAPAAAEQPPR